MLPVCAGAAKRIPLDTLEQPLNTLESRPGCPRLDEYMYVHTCIIGVRGTDP